MFKPSRKAKTQIIYIIICFFLISICLIHVLHKTYVMNANFLGYFEPAKSWDVTFDSELSLRQKTPGASKTNSEFAPKDRPSSQNEMLVSQNTKLVRGCVFAFWFLTMLSWNGLKFTVLFTPLVCCSECSDNKTVVAKLNLCVGCCMTITSILTSKRWRVDFAVETQKGGKMLLLLPDEMGKGWCKVRTWHQRCCIRCLCLSLRYRPEPEEMFGRRVFVFFFRMRFKMDIQNDVLVAMGSIKGVINAWFQLGVAKTL